MRQVTGSNNSATDKKVSIQLMLDGHSFSLASLDGITPSGEGVEIELLTERTMLVPRELFDASMLREMMAMSGIAVSADMEFVWSNPDAEVVAAMAVPAHFTRAIEERLGDKVRFTTPLLAEPAVTASALWLNRRHDLLYIKVYDSSLCLAEVIRLGEEAEMEYLVERLSARFPLGDYTLQLAGDDAAQMRRRLSKRFKTTLLCE